MSRDAGAVLGEVVRFVEKKWWVMLRYWTVWPTAAPLICDRHRNDINRLVLVVSYLWTGEVQNTGFLCGRIFVLKNLRKLLLKEVHLVLHKHSSSFHGLIVALTTFSIAIAIPRYALGTWKLHVTPCNLTPCRVSIFQFAFHHCALVRHFTARSATPGYQQFNDQHSGHRQRSRSTF